MKAVLHTETPIIMMFITSMGSFQESCAPCLFMRTPWLRWKYLKGSQHRWLGLKRSGFQGGVHCGTATGTTAIVHVQRCVWVRVCYEDKEEGERSRNTAEAQRQYHTDEPDFGGPDKDLKRLCQQGAELYWHSGKKKLQQQKKNKKKQQKASAGNLKMI